MDDHPAPAWHLKAWRKHRGLSQDALAIAAGTSKSYVSELERGERPLPPGQLMSKLAAALEISVGQLITVDPNQEPPASSPWDADLEGMLIQGDVRAGAWLEQDSSDQREPERYPAAADPRFPKAAQWLSRVRGDSMNALTKGGLPAGILDGDLVHIVNAIAIEYVPRTGDVVEVERIRFDGREREVTLKQVEMSGDTILLWPRSANPRWQEPIRCNEGVEGEEIEVRIRGKMLQVLRQF